VHHTGLSLPQAGLVLASGFVAMALTSPLAGRIVARFGAGRIAPVGALAIGEANNSAAGHYPIVCNIAQAAKWMWYNPSPSTITDPFQVGPVPNLPSDVNEYLIFRLSSDLATSTHKTTWGQLHMLYR